MEQQKQQWSHQPPAIDYLSKNRYAMLDASMGTGKSKIIIETLKRTIGGSQRYLILCPSSVLPVWRGQFAQHAPEQFSVTVLDGSGNSAAKAEKIKEALFRRTAGGPPLVVVVNYETFWRPAVWSVLNSVTWERAVLDESHRIKAHDSKCSQSAWRLGSHCGNRTAMTGTPMPRSPLDIFGQYRFLKEDIFGRYVTAFKRRYAIMNQWIPQKVDTWVNQEEMQERINRIRYFIPRSVLVLPDKQDIRIEVPLSPAGRRAYQDMKRNAIVEIKRQIHESDDHEVRTAIGVNGAVVFLRCLQLAQGYVGDVEGEDIDTDTEKRRVLLDLLSDAGEPVCVYGWFKHDLKVVRDCCDILGLRCGEISGERKDLTPHGKFPEDMDVMAVQCKSGSSGIDLTRSRIGIILNSGMLSPGDYDQMMARQYRPGQTRNVVYYHLVSPQTVDETIAKARAVNRDVIDAILRSGEFD